MSLREAARQSHFDASYLSKVINGHKPGTAYLAGVLDEVLGAGGRLAELAARRPANPPVAAGAKPEVDQAEPWEIADVLTRSPVSATALDFMERAITGFAACYPYTPPADLAPRVQAMLVRMKGALGSSQPVTARFRCVRPAGVLCGVAGQLADDAGQYAQAGGYFEAGELAAAEIGDCDLTAWILGVRSIGVFFRSGYPEAEAMLGRAQEAAASCTPRRRVWIDALSARSLAASAVRASGHRPAHREVMASLDSASSHLDAATGPSGETEFFDRPRLSGMAGTAMLMLRDTGRARSLLGDALASRSAADVKGRALLMLDLAECAAMDGEPEEAARLGSAALGTLGESVIQPVLRRTREVGRSLQRWESMPAVTELASHLAEVSRHPGWEG